MKQNLMRYLAPPGKLASALDWKKASASVLAIDVGSDKIGLAVASHPSFGEEPLRLDPLTLQLETRRGNRRVLSNSVVEELQQIVKSYNVAGFLVSWPVQESGRVGAPCGKVLHTLDSLLSASPDIVTTARPFCLWDDHHFAPDDDEFGRSAKYGEPCRNKTSYRASEEQYAHYCSSSVAANVWNDFCTKHWPELYQDELIREPGPTSCESYFKDDWLDSTDETETYTNAALL